MIRAGIPRLFRLALRRRSAWERDVEDEIKLHLALRAEQLAAQGAPPHEAYREAVRRFGPLDESRARLLEAARHREARMQRTEFIDDLRHDLRFAVRSLGRQKGWTAVTVITLALGIGATTAVFSVVSALLLHPIDYPNADRIVYVSQQPSNGNNTGIRVAMAPGARVVDAWKGGSRSFEAIEGLGSGPMALKTNGEPSRVASARIFPTLPTFAGQRPLFGRMFTDADIAAGGRVAVLGESFWRERFHAEQGVLGRAITLGDSLYTVVGVLPASFHLPDAGGSPTDVWLPLDIRNKNNGMSVVGRLRPGASIVAAERELDSIYARTEGFTSGQIPFRTVITTPAHSVHFHDSLILLTGAVGLVLLVAFANVAHLLLARSATRHREMAIRAALGAARGRLLRQLLTESLILSSAGTATGIGLGWVALRGMIALRPRAYDEIHVAHLDPTTLGIAIGFALLSATVFGIIGAFQSSRHSTHDSLKNGALSASASRGHRRARALLVVSEMALSAMLLVGATLLIRSVVNLQHTNLGFDPQGLYMLRFELENGFSDAPSRAAFMAGMMDRIRRMPAIRSAAVVSVPPSARSFSIGRLEVDGEVAPSKTSSAFIDVNAVQPGYFQTMAIPLTQGTTFTDTTPAARQVIVNAGFARKHWAEGRAIGHRVRIAQTDSEPWLTIVGVAGDASTSGPRSESSAPLLYTAAGDSPDPSVLVRTTGDAKSLQVVTAVARQMGLRRGPQIDSVEQFLGKSIAAPRFVMLLLAIFTALALLLACVGLYGVMAYTVTQQTREIGIRVALGASRSRVARSVLVRGSLLAIAGTAVGLGLASWGTKMIEHQLFGVGRSDVASFAGGALVLVLAAITACIVPTRRALAVDPMTAIRAD